MIYGGFLNYFYIGNDCRRFSIVFFQPPRHYENDSEDDADEVCEGYNHKWRPWCNLVKHNSTHQRKSGCSDGSKEGSEAWKGSSYLASHFTQEDSFDCQELNERERY